MITIFLWILLIIPRSCNFSNNLEGFYRIYSVTSAKFKSCESSINLERLKKKYYYENLNKENKS